MTPGASNQTALLQVTDLGTETFQRTSFVIAQATGTSPGFFVSPQSATFQGARADQCARSNGSVNPRLCPVLHEPDSSAQNGVELSLEPRPRRRQRQPVSRCLE